MGQRQKQKAMRSKTSNKENEPVSGNSCTGKATNLTNGRFAASLPPPLPDYDDGSRIYTTIPARSPGDKGHNDYSECALSVAMYRRIVETPNYPQPVPHPLLSNGLAAEQTMAITPVQDKGLGIVAWRDIQIGQLLLAERPLLAASAGIPLPHQPTEKSLCEVEVYERNLESQHAILQRAFSRMIPANQEAFMRLANSFPGDTRINGIAQTNARMLEEDTGGEYLVGVFRLASRFNHNCSPNVCCRWDPTSFSMMYFAARPISEGEELCISYVDISKPAKDRQEELKLQYAFDCRCKACTTTRTSSDFFRAQLVPQYDDRYEEEFQAWLKNPTLPDDHIYETVMKDNITAMTNDGLLGHSRFLDMLKLASDSHILSANLDEGIEV